MSKRLKIPMCKHCGTKNINTVKNDECAPCKIIAKRKSDAFNLWIKHRNNFNNQWLNTTLNFMLTHRGDEITINWLSIIIHNTHFTYEKVDTVAHLVILLFKCNQNDNARQIYSLFNPMFHEHKTDLSIVASTWVDDEIENARDSVERVIKTFRIKGTPVDHVIALYKNQIST